MGEDLTEPPCSQANPLCDAYQGRHSCQFPQHNQCQDQGRLIAHATFVTAILNLLTRVIHRQHIDLQIPSDLLHSFFQRDIVHASHSSLSETSSFSHSSRNGSPLLSFGTFKSPCGWRKR